MTIKTFKYKTISTLQTFNLDESLEKYGLEGWEAISMCAVYPKSGKIRGESAKTQELIVLLKKEELLDLTPSK